MSELRNRKHKGSHTLSLHGDDSSRAVDTKHVGVLSSWLRLVFCCTLAIILATRLHYSIPSPKLHRGVNPVTGTPEFSEYNAMETISYLSDTVGYRIVGTVEEAQTVDYLEQTLRSYKQLAQGVPGAPKIDIWTQKEIGSHRFDIMDKMVLKAYTNVTNVIVRLSCPDTDPTDSAPIRQCEKDAVLLNAHFDTTLGSPGATDDGSGIAVMLEVIRVLSQKDWSGYKNSVVFLFNGAEESLQDASHAFITMHDLKDTIRSVVNIDACGSSGREIVFQANSREMIEAYKQAPYPHGTVVANDVFRTGLILSDTDFRQFVQYGNLTGIDMAIYKNSYLYHTHLDTANNVQPGSMQHLGANTLAIVDYLAKNATLSGIEPTNEVVFFDVHGLYFVVYSWATAYKIQLTTSALACVYFFYVMIKTWRSSPYRPLHHILLSYTKSILVIFGSAVAALVFPIAVALFLSSNIVGRPMSWFAREWYGALIFCPAGFFGSYAVQWLSYTLPGPKHTDMEYGTFVSLSFVFVIITVLTTMTGFASSYISWIYLSVMLLANIVNEVILQRRPIKLQAQLPKVSTWAYMISTFPLALMYTDYTYALIDIFVPLAGRMGVDTPVDIIVGFIFGMVSFMICVPSVAHAHRFGRAALSKIALLLVVLQIAILGAVIIQGGEFGKWAFPYDEMHPKRVFVQHLKNLTSGTDYITLAEADRGPYIQTVVDDLESELGVKAEHRGGAECMADWDSIYPFSAFLGTYRFDVEPYLRSHSPVLKSSNASRITDALPGPMPTLSLHDDHYDPATGIRSFSLVTVAPSYTWTVISFDAEVLGWSFKGEEPLVGPAHYVVRHVAGFGSDGWKLDLQVKVPEDQRVAAAKGQWKMQFQLTALEEEGFANRGEERLIGGVGMLGIVRRNLPVWTTPTWLSAVVQVSEL